MKTEEKDGMPGIGMGEWTYYPDFGRLMSKNGKEYFLDNRLNKLLGFLLQKKAIIVTRDEILDSVWAEVQVNEENLTKGVFDLRKFLKEKEITGVEIETIRNVGYRLTVQKRVEKSRKSILKLAAKSLLFLFLILGFLIMLIRAINYEN